MSGLVSVLLEGGAPWGFRLAGGADFGAPLEVARVRKKSKADMAGLKEGDCVNKLDGQDVTQKSHGDAMTIIDAAGDRLAVTVTRHEGTAPGLATLTPQNTSYRGSPAPRQSTPHNTQVQHRESPTATAVGRISVQQSSATSSSMTSKTTTRMTTITSSSASQSNSLGTGSPILSRAAPSAQATLDMSSKSSPALSSSQMFLSMNGEGSVSHSSHPDGQDSGDGKTYGVWQAPSVTSTKTPAPVLPKPVQFRPGGVSGSGSPSVGRPAESEPYYVRSVNKPSIPAQPVHIGSQPSEPWTVDISSYKVETVADAPPKPPDFNIRKVDESRKTVWKPSSVPISRTAAEMSYASPQRGSSMQPDTGGDPMITSSLMSQSWHESTASLALSGIGGGDDRESMTGSATRRLPAKWKEETLYVNEETGETMTLEQLQRRMLESAMRGEDEDDEMDSVRKHHPGMVNPLVHDPSMQGEERLENTSLKRKIYADSTFYDAPNTDFPTIDEQIRLCRVIAHTLDSELNKSSRGGRMFNKRKFKAPDWSILGMGAGGPQAPPPDFTTFANSLTVEKGGGLGGYCQTDGLPLAMPGFSPLKSQFGYNAVRPHPSPIKQVLTAEDIERMKAGGPSYGGNSTLCQHNTLSPSLAFNVASALQQSGGKGAQIFAKKRDRAEKYVVDESNVRKVPAPPPPMANMGVRRGPAGGVSGGSLLIQAVDPAKPYKSPWEAAIEGNMDRAFDHLGAYKRYEVKEMMPAGVAGGQLNVAVNSTMMGHTQSPSLLSPPVTKHHPTQPSPGLEVKYKPYKPVTGPQRSVSPSGSTSMNPSTDKAQYAWSPPTSGTQSPAPQMVQQVVTPVQNAAPRGGGGITYDPYNYIPVSSGGVGGATYPQATHTLLPPNYNTSSSPTHYFKNFNTAPKGFPASGSPAGAQCQPDPDNRGISAF